MTPVERASQVLQKALPEPGPSGDVPLSVVAAVRAAMVRERQRRQSVRYVFLALAASVAIAGASGVLWLRSRAPEGSLAVASFDGAVVLTPASGAAVGLAQGMRIEEGAAVTTHAGGHAELTLKSGGEIELMESTELALERASTSQRLLVRKGSMRVHVKPLAPGHTFVVATEDAEVEVKGTRFEVQVLEVDASCDVATATRVHVDEGTVWVRQGDNHVELHAGGTWPHCGATAPVAPMPAAQEPEGAPAPAHEPGATPPRAAAGAAQSAREATLAEQNASYHAAIAARRRGDFKTAIAGFASFYETYPRSPMAEAARVEHLRLLHKLSDPSAADAARAYLSAYPNGFARDEARAIVGP